jgi:hypothetical protein
MKHEVAMTEAVPMTHELFEDDGSIGDGARNGDGEYGSSDDECTESINECATLPSARQVADDENYDADDTESDSDLESAAERARLRSPLSALSGSDGAGDGGPW